MKKKLTVIIEKDEQGFFIGSVPELKSCYTQAKSIEELLPRIREVAELCLEEQQEEIEFKELISIEQIEVDYA